ARSGATTGCAQLAPDGQLGSAARRLKRRLNWAYAARLVANQQGNTVLDTDDLATLVADPEVEVQELAIEALARAVEPERLFPGVLEDRIAVEPESYLRGLLMRLGVAGCRARPLL